MSLERSRMRVPTPPEVLDYARVLGLRRTLARAAYVGANRVVALSILDCLRLGPNDVNHALLQPGPYEARFLTPEETGRLAAALEPAAAAITREAAARGDSCYAVLDGERPATVGFFASLPTPILGDLVLNFDHPYWYRYGGFTPAPYRGRRLHALGILRASRELFARGVPGLVAVCERTNHRALVSSLRMGWQPCGTLVRIGVGPRYGLWRTAEARAAGLHLTRREEDEGA